MIAIENIPSILFMIRQRYQDLTNVEKRVADYILSHSDSISGMRIYDLAVASGVANSAVVRFCKALGYTGYAEFKFSFSAETNEPAEPFMLPLVQRDDGIIEIFNKVFTSNIHSMYETIQHLDMDKVNEAVNLLQNARHILLIGTGPSEPVAIDGTFHLMQFGISASYAINGCTMRTAALNLGPGGVAIAISHCGHTIDTVDSMRFAKRSGAATIAITSYADSPLCKEADVALVSHSGDIPYLEDNAIISTRTSHICILDALSVSVACRNYDQSIERIYARNNIVFPCMRY